MAAFEAGKPVLCEKPLGPDSLDEAREMAARAETAGVAQYDRLQLRPDAGHAVCEKADRRWAGSGRITWFRGEHTEDFYADPHAPATWRTTGEANGCMGDLAPHPINCAHALMGDIAEVFAVIETVHKDRGGVCGDE